jgi:hypothetical protein
MLPRELEMEFTGDNPGGAEAKPPQDNVSYNRCQSNPADSSSSCVNDPTQFA